MQREPVAELPTRAPNEIGTGAAALELDPGAHALILPLEQRTVAVRDVHHPGHDDRRITPAGSARRVRRVRSEDVGNHPGQAAARVLIGGEICQPLRKESGDVHVERRGWREDLRVAGPAEPLIPLRAIGGHVEEVAALPPDDVLLQPVQQRVRCFE